jgi:hypothetical protein
MIIEENASGKLPPAASIVSPMTESGIPKVLPKECNNRNYWLAGLFHFIALNDY